jgi:hypothetical protein
MSSEFSLQEPFHFQVVHCFNPMKNFLGVLRQQQKSVFQTFEAQPWQRSLVLEVPS